MAMAMAVSVINTGGSIKTTGNGSGGIFAQAVGGGAATFSTSGALSRGVRASSTAGTGGDGGQAHRR
jgi:hypothetical protein